MKDLSKSVEGMLSRIEGLDRSIRLAEEFKCKSSQQPEYLMQANEEIEALKKMKQVCEKALAELQTREKYSFLIGRK